MIFAKRRESLFPGADPGREGPDSHDPPPHPLYLFQFFVISGYGFVIDLHDVPPAIMYLIIIQ